MPPRIVLIGAGSVTFTRNLLADFLAHPALRGSDLVLHDIDSDRLRTAERMARWTAQALGAEPRIEAHLDRPTALRGADIVVNTIQVGGERATRIDFQVPARYGLRYTINDTINVGGVFRALRTIPVVLGLTRDMETICPDAWLLNYTNPMSSLMWAIAKSSGVRAVGLCHSVYWSVRRIAHYLGLPPDELEAVSGGINHLAFILRLRRRGEDLYPQLRRFFADHREPEDDRVRGELCRRLGFYPTESSEHHAEYSPWFIPKPGMVARFNVPLDEYLVRVQRNLDEYEATKRRLDAGEPFEIAQSGEYAAVVANALVTGHSATIVGNVPNDGLIDDVTAGACVEVPCQVDGTGIHPVAIGRLPLQCAAYLHPAVDAQELTVHAALEHDREAIYYAVMQDPLVQAALTLDEVWKLTDELIAEEAEWLPSWLGGSWEPPRDP